MLEQLKRTINISLPLIVANLVQILMGIIDSAMVGAINAELLAAAALVNNVYAVPYILGLGLTLAIGPLIAIGIGRNDPDEPREIFVNSILICGIFGIIVAVIIHLGSGFIYYLGQDPGVATSARSYLIIIGWSNIPMILFLAVKQFADGMENTKLPMLISLYTIPLNILLNYLLIYGNFGFPRLELDGAGYATFITRCVLAIAMFVVLWNNKEAAKFLRNATSVIRFNLHIIRKILSIGIPSSLQYGLEAWAFSFSGIMVGWLGVVALAAHQIALSIASITFMIALGLSAAGSIRVGNNYGKGDWLILRSVGKGVILLAMILGLSGALVFILFKNQLPLFFNRETEVIALAASLLVIAAFFQISDAVQAIGVGLLRGLQDVRIPTLFVTIAYWVIGIPFGYVLAFNWGLGVRGIWFGLLIGLTVSAFLLTYRFFSMTKKQMTTYQSS